MITLSGLAACGHPLVEAAEAYAVADGVMAIAGAPAAGAPADAYALAARWCARGVFLPFSWRRTVTLEALLALGAASGPRIAGAVALAEGCVELAFQLRRAREPVAPAPSRAGPGRAYLRALADARDPAVDFLERLRAAAPEGGFSLSIVNATREGATGLARCRAVRAADVRLALRGIGGPGAELAVSGPLPPFGAGIELVERLGLTAMRRAA